ncbi:MAG TPA: class I SAM-dependent methyltransferase [Steroidobacteraceae bacterium]|jgi:S-adenosylmethionine-diacylgycerolhomoserine-N-methlytransferase|nr:class I SAM-dependent methyltransferase [Steroidobacteraceae bacterium]
MSPPDLLADSRVLWRMLRGLPRNGSAAQRLQAFYAPQAGRYDAFRKRLLHGREELLERLPAGAGDVVVELGCGTGENLERLGSRVARLRRLVLVDLCPALLAQARTRAERLSNVEVVEADIGRYRPPEAADCVYLSYALTMVEDWRAVIANAVGMIKPGGTLGVVDFYVSSACPARGGIRHPGWERWLWRRWFAHDGVRLDPVHMAQLATAVPDCRILERRGKVPYLPALTAPYYLFIGRKR